jgi:prepilin-type N-terminal cleavage/methylation domain-containing protein
MPVFRSSHRALPLRRAGFTILELVVVISIVAIMTSMALPAFTRIVEQTRLDRAAQSLSYDLQAAFAIVGRNRKPVRISWVPAKVQFSITDRFDTLFKSRPMGLTTDYKLSPSMFTVSNPQVDIFPPGLAADSLNIHIVNGKLKRTISMSRGGLVRVLKL